MAAAYTTYMIQRSMGDGLLGPSLVVSLAVAFVVAGTIGLLLERLLIRRLYGRSPDDPLLLTFGLSLAMVEGAKLIWGKIGLTFEPPKQLASAADLGFMNFPVYRLFVIAVTAAVLIALWLFLEKTNVGLVIRVQLTAPQEVVPLEDGGPQRRVALRGHEDTHAVP